MKRFLFLFLFVLFACSEADSQGLFDPAELTIRNDGALFLFAGPPGYMTLSTGVDTEILGLSAIPVQAGDYVLVFGLASVEKEATDGKTKISIQTISGPAISQEWSQSIDQLATSVHQISVSGVVYASSEGDLELGLFGLSEGSNGRVADQGARLDVVVLSNR